MKNLMKVTFAIASVCMLIACSGDPRPLEEAVEASEIGLSGLVIKSDHPESDLIDDPIKITINHGQVVNFRFIATGIEGQTLSVENTNRRWSVSNSDIASISDSGRLVGRSDGVVSVGLRIGGIFAESIPVRVSDAELESISLIEGQETLVECSISDEYTALGNYSDTNPPRPIDQVEWSVADGSQGVLIESTDFDAIVGSQSPGSITLTAKVGDISGSTTITVVQGLASLTIAPSTLIVERSAEKQLIATAAYSDNTTQRVTELVTWSSSDTDIATVSDELDSKGTLRGVSLGQTTISTACGDATESQVVDVIAPADVIRLNVEPEDDPITMSLSGDTTLQLKVSAESSAGSIEDVTDNADWRIVTGDDVVDVDNSGASRGTVTALSAGTATLEISYLGVEKTVTIRVR